jgi:hypothetical protein
VISRFIGVLLAIMVAYATAVLLGSHLPAIKIKTEASRPLTLAEILTKYLVHAPDERVHLLTTPRPAEWDTAQGLYALYDLANDIPELDETYAPTGSQVESLYETLLLSIRAGDDAALEKLQKDYLAARNKAASRSFSTKVRNEHRAAQQKALESLLRYTQIVNSGPAPKAHGKALRDFYGATTPYVQKPDSDARNPRVVIATPPLSTLTSSTASIPAIDILVPAERSAIASRADLAVRAQHFRIAEVTLSRPWLDPTLLARSNGPWIAGDPNLFGSHGKFARIPIRLALVQRPAIDTSTADATSIANGPVGAAIGPFKYSANEVTTKDNMLALRPETSQWIVLAVISKELSTTP